MYGVTRGVATIVGAGAAWLLLWLATQVGGDANPDYWAFIGLTAAAGLALALSQLVGGWTKRGRPSVSLPVLLIGFVPALVVGGWVLLAGQPESNWFASRADEWAGDIGLAGVLADMLAMIPAIAFGLGLLFGLVFDTSGPRVRAAEADERGALDDVAAEPVTAERVERFDRVERDDEFHEPDRAAVAALADDQRIEIREGGSPIAPQPGPEADREPEVDSTTKPHSS